MAKAKVRKIKERNQTGEKWAMYEIEFPYASPTEIILSYEA